MSVLCGIEPVHLGLPEKFSCWRPYQEEAITYGFECKKRFLSLAMPTGAGKSACYIAMALLERKRAVILTSTKGLQDQLLRDFSTVGLVDIRGRGNYPCSMSPGLTCEDGAHLGCRASLAGSCPYKTRWKEAREAQLVITNYAYWMLVNEYGEGLGPVDYLILDEAHDAPEEVCNVLAVHLTYREVRGMLRERFPSQSVDLDSFPVWKRWASRVSPKIEAEVETRKQYIAIRGGQVDEQIVKEFRSWRALHRKFNLLATAQGPWIGDPIDQGFAFNPLWPSAYTEQVLFRHVKRILMTSATILPKTVRLLLPEGEPDESFEFHEFPYMFPRYRCPVVHVPTVRVDHKMDDAAKTMWLARMDQIISRRLDRKGLIHAVSYARRDLILSRSEHTEIMVTHAPSNAQQQIAGYKSSPPPAVLVSPSVTTGYDFPYSQCEYLIVAKLPFPDSRSLIMKAREEADPEYLPYLTAQTLVQEAGRGMRAKDDQCEVFILDDHWFWFRRKCVELLPNWFRKLCRTSDTIPEPPNRLEL